MGVLLVLGSVVLQPARGNAQRAIPITESLDSGLRVELEQVLAIGSADGRFDAFGRITDASFDNRGNIIVVDDFNLLVSIFDSTGRFIRAGGRRGRGPGEFQSPWRIAVDPNDSLFVWDAAAAKVVVFTADLVYSRAFRVPPHWIITGMEFLPNGEILVSAFGKGEKYGLHVLDRDGGLRDSYGEITNAGDLAGFEGSVLGGSVAILAGQIAYSRKSPYRITIYGSGRQPLHECLGDPRLTTNPAEIVVRNARGAGLEWGKYVHSSSILFIANSLLLNVIHDPVRERRIFDLITPDCRLMQRTVVDSPVNPVRSVPDKLLAIRNLDYPEVVVYHLRFSQP